VHRKLSLPRYCCRALGRATAGCATLHAATGRTGRFAGRVLDHAVAARRHRHVELKRSVEALQLDVTTQALQFTS